MLSTWAAFLLYCRYVRLYKAKSTSSLKYLQHISNLCLGSVVLSLASQHRNSMKPLRWEQFASNHWIASPTDLKNYCLVAQLSGITLNEAKKNRVSRDLKFGKKLKQRQNWLDFWIHPYADNTNRTKMRGHALMRVKFVIACDVIIYTQIRFGQGYQCYRGFRLLSYGEDSRNERNKISFNRTNQVHLKLKIRIPAWVQIP